ncbi:MAG: hypothetical protein IT379_24595 [Deltaproteobacteria bacterium]|nr:hypothetical protein [Deltaproteobacteria bacterium]
MIAVSVKTEISRRAVASGITLERALAEMVPALSHDLAKDVRARVQQRGDLAGQPFPGWRQWTPRAYAVSPRYPDGITGRVSPSGAEWYKSRPDYHAQRGTRPGTYTVSGGMWDGLSVVVDTNYRARIMFRGRSEGQNPNFTRRQRGGAQGPVRIRPLKINNSLKAWTVLRAHGVNVLALAEAELAGIARDAVNHVARGIGAELPVVWNGRGPS